MNDFLYVNVFDSWNPFVDMLVGICLSDRNSRDRAQKIYDNFCIKAMIDA